MTDTIRGQVGAYHRTLSTYLNTAVAAGWLLERLVEPANGFFRSESRDPGASPRSVS
jgi:hypothetical protein